MKNYLTGKTTLAELEDALFRREVASLVVNIDRRPSVGMVAGLTLHALRGPEGIVTVSAQRASALSSSITLALTEADILVSRSIVVRDELGRLRAVYPNDENGQRLAEGHMRSLGRGASMHGSVGGRSR